MSKLEKGLEEWVSLGLISADQAKRIQDHESKKPESSWILSGLLILGAVIIGLGVISVIAANWANIPDAVKLGADFLILGVLAAATFKSWEAKKFLHFEVLLLLFLLFCLASIGLISQIYHTGGKFSNALLLWSVITSGAALTSRFMFVPFLWSSAFLVGLVLTVFESTLLEALLQKNYLCVLLVFPLLSACFAFVSQRILKHEILAASFRMWMLIAGLIGLAVLEFQAFTNGASREFSTYLPAYVLAVLVAFGISQSLTYRSIQKILLLSILLTFLIEFHLHMIGLADRIAYAVMTILTLGLTALFVASLKFRKLFQWLLFFLGMRFLILYFQALGGLAMTGFGLIISGVIVMGLAYLWNKYRSAIAVWAERLSQ